jgi:antitoxin (DNA-binding transcriptional repressor) of toxin-antitoxin stability system
VVLPSSSFPRLVAETPWYEVDDHPGDEIEITKHGRTVARLVPAVGPRALAGRLEDTAVSSADDEDLFSTGLTWDLR